MLYIHLKHYKKNLRNMKYRVEILRGFVSQEVFHIGELGMNILLQI